MGPFDRVEIKILESTTLMPILLRLSFNRNHGMYTFVRSGSSSFYLVFHNVGLYGKCWMMMRKMKSQFIALTVLESLFSINWNGF